MKLVDNIEVAMNNDKIFCGCFGLFPSYVAGILNSVKEINFHVLCNERFNYTDYIEQCISGKECTISFKFNKGDYFRLSFGSKTIVISFEARLIHGQLTSELIFAHGMLKTIVYRLWHME